MSDDDAFFQEIQGAFLQESKELLSKVESLSLQLEKDPQNKGIYEELARLAHNFKGTGKAVGFGHISKLGHGLEDFILAMRNGLVPTSGPQLDFLFSCLDRLRADVDKLCDNPKLELDYDIILSNIRKRIDAESAPKVEAKAEPQIESKVESPKQEIPGGLPKVPPPPTQQTAPVGKSQAAVKEVFRVPKEKLDYLLEVFGEQVILQSTLEQCRENLSGNRDLLMKTISQLSKLTNELQNHALSLAMVQMGPLFSKLERAIRDAAKLIDKKVQVVFEGVETEVDKTVVDALSDPLVHMVRNAIDHGLESNAQRIELGKNPIGTIGIRAVRIGGQLWIEVTDDGKGLDPEMLKAKAIQKGLISPEAAAALSPEGAYRLIFANGFSTKEVVSELSGRGVGMNVVEETVHSLKGTIDIESEIGKGSCFRLKLPLSLAIFNGTLIRVGTVRFVVPSSEIDEIGRVRADELLVLVQGSNVIRFREEIYELIDLRSKFNTDKYSKENIRKDLPVLLTRHGKNCAFLIDEIIGMQKVVQKPLSDEMKSHPEFAAGTILGDGAPSIVLNLKALVGHAA